MSLALKVMDGCSRFCWSSPRTSDWYTWQCCFHRTVGICILDSRAFLILLYVINRVTHIYIDLSRKINNEKVLMRYAGSVGNGSSNLTSMSTIRLNENPGVFCKGVGKYVTQCFAMLDLNTLPLDKDWNPLSDKWRNPPPHFIHIFSLFDKNSPFQIFKNC